MSLAEIFVDAVEDAIRKHPAFPVIKGGQLALVKAGMDPKEAWHRSREVLVEFLNDEKVTVGDPAYGWDEDAGATLVEEYELRFWEPTNER